MPVRTDHLPLTDRSLDVSAALAQGVLPTGLTAPAFRAFLVLLASADGSGQIDILKPELERLSGNRMDNAHRFLDRLRDALIDAQGVEPAPWFNSLVYTPGVEKRLAGVIRGELSPAARALLASPRYQGQVQLQVDELRRLSTVPGVILYLRCQAILAAKPSAREIVQRWNDDELLEVFGQYAASARSVRKLGSGETSVTVSLSRMTAALLRPGADDLRAALDTFTAAVIEGKPLGAGRGKAWSHVDLVLQRLSPRPKLMDLIAAQNERIRYLDERDKILKSIGS
jgi:hypothetical protein